MTHLISAPPADMNLYRPCSHTSECTTPTLPTLDCSTHARLVWQWHVCTSPNQHQHMIVYCSPRLQLRHPAVSQQTRTQQMAHLVHVLRNIVWTPTSTVCIGQRHHNEPTLHVQHLTRIRPGMDSSPHVPHPGHSRVNVYHLACLSIDQPTQLYQPSPH
jgi:hypothetical protein